MRTQLLHAVPVIEPEEECDYDTASNDECREAATTANRLSLSLTAAPDADSPQSGALRNTREANDDYWLDGYAGI